MSVKLVASMRVPQEVSQEVSQEVPQGLPREVTTVLQTHIIL